MAEKVDSSMPINLSRSVLTVLVPGIVAIAPWLLALVQHTSATLGFKEYQTLAHALLFAAVIVVGTLCQGFGSFLERKWDKDLETELEVAENWYAYLARPLDHEPVGYRYLSRLVTTMYFELSMLFAVPIFVLGAWILAVLRFPGVYWLSLAASIGLYAVSIAFFFFQARITHRTICETRREVVKRLETPPPRIRFGPRPRHDTA